MKNKKIGYIFSNEFTRVFYTLALIQIIFLFITRESHYFSDDYGLIIGLKLYNLVQGHFLTFQDLFQRTITGHYGPLYLFTNQFMPYDYFFFHTLVVLFFFISSLLIFLITEKLTKDYSISFLTSVMFCLNYSIHIKPLVWNAFHHTVTNSTMGLLSILIFVISFEKNKLIWLWYFFYLFFAVCGVFLYENGLIYPIITSLIIILFKKKNIIRKIIIALMPIAIFFSCAFLLLEEKPAIFDRFDKEYEEKRSDTFIKVDSFEKKIYFYRSPYAKRDFTGYTFRTIDNIASSINLYSLENVIKYYFDRNYLKHKILENFKTIIIVFGLLTFLFIFYLFAKLKFIILKKYFYNFIIIYLILFSVFTFVIFRQDVNTAMAFPASVLISTIIIELYRKKFFILSITLLLLYFMPSFLYATTGFEHVKYWAARSTVFNSANSNFQDAKNKNINSENLTQEGFIFLYYYVNYKDYENYLSQYKDLNYENFKEKIKLSAEF